jgi:rod shape-determining protein MreC
MQWIIQFIVRHRSASSLCLTVMVSLWMLSAPSGRQHQIARGLSLSLFYPFQFTFSQLARTRNIIAENRRLREESARLRTDLSLLREQVAENHRLRELTGFADSVTCALLPVRVIAREPSAVYRSCVINGGAQQGIQLYMPVVSKNGVVGKVVQVLPYIGLVQLLKDPAARTSVMLQRDRSVGILETENGRDFFVNYRAHVDVRQGDTVVTSGLGGIYPKGLLAGYVTKIEKAGDPLFVKVVVEPSVDFERIEEIFVMRLSPQWFVRSAEIDSLSFGK